MRAPVGYIAALAVVGFGILALLRVVPVFPAPPVVGGCAWWNIWCQAQTGAQNAYNTALYAVARLVAAIVVAVVAFLLLILPLGSLGPRALAALGLALVAFSLGTG